MFRKSACCGLLLYLSLGILSPTLAIAQYKTTMLPVTEPSRYINERNEVCQRSASGPICRAPRDSNEVENLRRQWRAYEKQERTEAVSRCEFSLIWSWKSEAERHWRAVNSRQNTIQYAQEELRWAGHDIQNRRFLPSDTVREAISNRQSFSQMLSEAVAKRDMHASCARYAEAKASGKNDDEAYAAMQR
jgi:hypothetical protein